MNKRYLCILLSAMLLIVLSACGEAPYKKAHNNSPGILMPEVGDSVASLSLDGDLIEEFFPDAVYQPSRSAYYVETYEMFFKMSPFVEDYSICKEISLMGPGLYAIGDIQIGSSKEDVDKMFPDCTWLSLEGSSADESCILYFDRDSNLCDESSADTKVIFFVKDGSVNIINISVLW